MAHLTLLESTPDASRRIATRVAAMLLCVLATHTASAQEPEPAADPSTVSTVLIVQDEPDERWRESGLAYIDFPLGFRARFDTSYTRHSYSSDVLAQPYLDDFGPGIRQSRSLESRIALTRPIMQGVELEIAWETRNSLATSDPLGFGRQTIGARIRISP